MPLQSFRPLGASVIVLLAVLAGCKGEKPTAPPPPKPVAQAPAAPTRTREQAEAGLMALPELKAWSEQIEKNSHGKAHGAVIEDDPAPRILNGKSYYQLSFVENRPKDVHRIASFLVARQGDEVLVEDDATDSVQSLGEWRRSVHRVELKSL
jgi:hypothetical protein